jgi:FkbM family methyltransferase
MLRWTNAVRGTFATGLLLAWLACTAAGTRAYAQPPAQPAPAPAPAPAAARGNAEPEQAVAFSCPVRGPFGPGTRFYSQFYEDYILAYVFKGIAKGTYVDVGAYDPNTASVTKRFYLQGWRGVNIEPNPELRPAFLKERPEDVNLEVGISDAAATLTFYKFEERASGLSTFDPEIAQRHKKAGYTYEEMAIPVVTLSQALEKSGIVTGDFELLNADVEGFERKVLAGLDFKKYRPKVIMLEATTPLTQEPTQQKWEDIVFANGYSFALDDGLNRYYVQRTQPELQARFLEAAYCVSRDKLSKGIQLDGFLAEPGR